MPPTSHTRTEPIAIVGMAGRFPDAPDVATFWRNLAAGHESIVSFSDEELVAAGIDAAALADPAYVKKGTVLEGAECFDATFFGLSPREAEGLDPQHRVFLECAHHAMEDAGHSGDLPRLTVGVFAGTSLNSYLFAHVLANREVLAALGGYQLMLGNDKDFLSTRVAYKLNLRGPCVTVQTACSTSLVAIQLACQSLRSGQCDMALAGGVSLTFPQRTGYLFAEEMIHSRDGHCRPFDANASGTRGSAGCGVVVLRRLADAERDRDHIRAVILGAAVNNDGARKVGFTAPSVEGQAECIRAAHAEAGIAADTIGYVEAHGTGTKMGDPIEFSGLVQAFRATSTAQNHCALGSLKSNIGHLDAAAGVGGVIKTVLALEQRQIPPTLNFTTLNPEIRAEGTPFYIADRLQEWTAHNGPRRAGVSSFGIGGTNAHVVLEEAPPRPPSSTTRQWQLLNVSARTPDALRRSLDALGARLREAEGPSLADVAYTLHVGRRRFATRVSVVASSSARAAIELAAADALAHARTVESGASVPPVAFLFPGQGTQHFGMGAELARTEPVFAAHLDACARALQPHWDFDLRSAIGATGAATDAPVDVNRTSIAQPALFAIEYALARTFMSWGITPRAMLGHSLGEYVAACVAGVISLEDALALIAERGRLMESAPGAGGMLAVPLPAAHVAEMALPLSIAAVNGPSLTVVSGALAAIAELELLLGSRGLQTRRLHTSHAFHSELMDPILDRFRACVARVALHAPQLPYVSNLTGGWIRPEECTDPDYWVAHLRRAVQFSDGVETLTGLGSPVLLELGPGDALTSLARPIAATRTRDIISTMPRRAASDDEGRTVMQALGRAWMAGVDIDWVGVHAHDDVRRVPLPGYPFEPQRHVVEPSTPESNSILPQPSSDVAEWFAAPAWVRTGPLSSASSAPPPGRTWLVFVSGTALDAAVLDTLGDADVWTVVVGPAFARLDGRRLQIVPDEPQHYEQLLAAVAEDGHTVRSILHLWNVTGANDPGSVERAFYSPLYLARALADRAGASVELVVASTGLQAVTAADTVQPLKSLLIGPTRVVPQELPHFWCASIDLPTGSGATELAAIARALVDEVRVNQPSRVIAFRDGARWEQTFRPLRLEQPDVVPLRAHGVYLITGGFGGIGASIARHLAATYQARLVLTTRAPLPPRDAWSAWVASNPESDATSARIRTVMDLEANGAQVMVMAADASDAEAFGAELRQVAARVGAINGIVHAAGLPGGGVVQRLSRADADAVLGPKVTGTLALEPFIDADGLDFVLLCSSINAVAGGAASSDYTAANAFLDAFAAAHRGKRTRVLAVNWGPWRDVGMAWRAAQGRQHGVKHNLHTYGMSANDGVETARRALAAGRSQLVVTTTPPAFALALQADREAAAYSHAKHAQPPSRHQPAVGAAGPATAGLAEPVTEVQNAIREIWIELLGVRAVGLDDDFFALGGHSLLATSVLTRVRQRLGAHVSLPAFFDAPTIRAFAALIDGAAVPVPHADDAREEFEL